MKSEKSNEPTLQKTIQEELLHNISQVVKEQRESNRLLRLLAFNSNALLKTDEKATKSGANRYNMQDSYVEQEPNTHQISRILSKISDFRLHSVVRERNKQKLMNQQEKQHIDDGLDVFRKLDQTMLLLSERIVTPPPNKTNEDLVQEVKSIHQTIKLKNFPDHQNSDNLTLQLIQEIKSLHQTIRQSQQQSKVIHQIQQIHKIIKKQSAQSFQNQIYPRLISDQLDLQQKSTQEKKQQIKDIKEIKEIKETKETQQKREIGLEDEEQSPFKTLIKLISEDKNIRKEEQNNKILIKKDNFESTKLYYRLYELQPYCDRREIKLKVNFQDLLKKFNVTKITEKKAFQYHISEWLGVTYRATASICWNMLQSHQLNFDEVKILFTQNIVFNFIELMKDINKMNLTEWAGNTAQIVNRKSLPVLTFLCKQYPQTKIDPPNMTLREILPVIDQKGRIEYELVRKSGVEFRAKKNRDYASEIMKFINYLIEVSNKEYDDFEDIMNSLFSKLFLPIQLRNKPNENYFDLKGDTRSRIMEDNLLSNPNHATYYEKVKKYTKYLIGRKIPKHAQMYTEQEIENGVFFIKSSATLRVLAKWVEQLTQVVEKPDYFIRDWFHPFKMHNGQQYYATYPIRKGIHAQIVKTRKEFLQKLEGIRNQCYRIEGQLSKSEYITDVELGHLSEQQINVGLFASNLKNSLSSYLSSSLNEVIHFLLSCPLKVEVKNLGVDKYFQQKAKTQLNNINLVTFRVFDLLRCKCLSGEGQIIWLVNQLKEMERRTAHAQQDHRFTIVRFKDRLNMGSRDILINAQIGKGTVFEMQLSVTNQVEEKQELLDKYNHFLYELRRSTMLGPLIENVHIWSNLQQRASYFQELALKKFAKCTPKPYKHICNKTNFRKYHSPMICESCSFFFHIQKTCIPNRSCSKCRIKICGQCYYDGLSPEDRKKELFQKLAIKEFMVLIQEVKESNAVPKSAFFFKKNVLKAQLAYMTSYSVASDGQSKPFVKAVQTTIRNNRIVNRGLVTNPQQLSRLSNFIIFQLKAYNQEFFSTIQQIRKLDEENEHKLRIINLLFEPNYPEKVKEISNQKKKQKFLMELQKIIEKRKIKIVRFKKLIIMVHVEIQGQQLQKALIIDQNIDRLRQFAQSSSSVVSIQRKNMTIQMSLLRAKIGEQLYKDLCKNVNKMYLNYGMISSIQSLSLMIHLNRLQISDNKIASLKGVEKMIRLKVINFQRNQIASLEPLRKLIKLQVIMADENIITSMKGIEALICLKQLSLHSNNILKIQALDKLTQLKTLYLRSNKIQKLEGVNNLIKLSKLTLSSNPLGQIKNLNSLKSMVSLTICQVKMTQIPKLSIICLQKLSLDENELQKIQNLEGLVNLKVLTLSNNKIQKIQGLSQLKLTKLNLDSNQIKVIEGIKTFLDTLEELSIRNNPIQSCLDLLNTEIEFKLLWTKETFTISAQLQLRKIYKRDASLLMAQKVFMSASLVLVDEKEQEKDQPYESTPSVLFNSVQ